MREQCVIVHVDIVAILVGDLPSPAFVDETQPAQQPAAGQIGGFDFAFDAMQHHLREAMAQAVKSPEVIKTFETAGSPVAYLDAPEFSKFVATDSARLIAAVKKIGKVE